VPPAGLPSALLERRPDVRAAEENLAAANAQIGVAKAALLPRISLTGYFGGESKDLAALLSSSGRIWSTVADSSACRLTAEPLKLRRSRATTGIGRE